MTNRVCVKGKTAARKRSVMKKSLFACSALALLAVLMLAAGCGGKVKVGPVEGTYRVTGADRTLELRADGNYLLKDGPSSRGGSYEVKDDRVLLEFAGVEDERSGTMENRKIVLDGYVYERQ